MQGVIEKIENTSTKLLKTQTTKISSYRVSRVYIWITMHAFSYV